MTIASGITIFWPSTSASIPSGWTRETNLDGYYFACAGSGADADLTTVNGNANHSHTAASHTHNVSGNTYTAARHPNSSGTTTIVAATHTHAAKASNTGSTTTSSTSTNDLARLALIFIKSNGTPTGIPDGAICMFRTDSFGAGWTRVGGDLYVKGAAAGGAGSTTQVVGSVNSHEHTLTHSHAAQTSNTRTGTDGQPDASVTTVLSSIGHTHSVSLNSAVATYSTETVEPAYRKINFIKNDTGGTAILNKTAALWNGTDALIPTDWARLTDYDGKFIKGANADGESDVSTGGSDASVAHAHTQTHNHTASDAGANGNTFADDTLSARGALGALDAHQHTWTVANDSTGSGNSAAGAHYPQYKKYILIEWTDPTAAAASPQMALMGAGQ